MPTYYENIDEDKLAFILRHREKYKYLQAEFHNKTADLFKIAEQYSLLKTPQGMRVFYKPSELSKGGRLFAKWGLSMASIARTMRHVVCGENYDDIDMVNAHPTMYLQVAKELNFKGCHFMKNYIKNRENVLKQIMKEKGIKSRDFPKNRDMTKREILMIINGSEIKKKPKFIPDPDEVSDNSDSDNESDDEWSAKPSLLDQFKQEHKKFMKVFIRKCKEFIEESQYRDGTTEEMKPYCYLNKIFCSEEREILDGCISRLREITKSRECDKIIMCFDGMMVPKSLNAGQYIEEFDKIGEFSGIKFKVKGMDNTIDIPRELFEKEKKLYQTYDEINDMPYDENLTRFDIMRWAYNSIVIIDNGGAVSYYAKTNTADGGITWKYRDIKYLKNLKNMNVNLVNGEEVSVGKLVWEFYTNRQLRTFSKGIFCPLSYDPTITPPKGHIPPRAFNTFSGFNTPEIVNPSPFEESEMYAHIKKRICNNDSELLDYILSYIATTLRHPYIQVPMALVLYGNQGCGKDTFVNFLELMLRPRHIKRIEKDTLLDKDFNADFEGKLMAVGNEISERFTTSGDGKHDHMKSRIAQKYIRIERKGKDIDPDELILNYIRWIFLTNNPNSMYIEDSDRRMCLIYVASLEGTVEEKKKYFDAIYDEIGDTKVSTDPSFLAGAWKFFMERDISNFSYVNFPNTKYKNRQKYLSLNISVKFGIECVREIIRKREGKEDVSSIHLDHITPQTTMKDKSIIFSRTALYDSFKGWCEDQGINKPPKKQWWLTTLEEWGFVKKNTSKLRGIHFPLDIYEKIKKRLGFDPAELDEETLTN